MAIGGVVTSLHAFSDSRDSLSRMPFLLRTSSTILMSWDNFTLNLVDTPRLSLLDVIPLTFSYSVLP